MTVVYIDLLFMLNLTANYLLLLGSGRVAGCPLKRIRIGLGAAAGALYAVAVFLPGAQWLSAWPCKGASGILMTLIAFGGQSRLLRVTAIFFTASAALAGLVLGAELLGGNGLTVQNGVFYSAVDIRLLLLLFVLCYFLMSLLFRRTGRHRAGELVALEIRLHGKTITMTALRDSGHSLTDPVTNRTVVVAEHRYLAETLPDEIDPRDPISGLRRCQELGLKGARLIPYRAVGVDCGMLLALKTDSVSVNGRGVGSLLMALSPNPVDDGGAYQALIGGDV